MKLFFVLLSFLIVFNLWAAGGQGSIPREYMNNPAVDLMYKGELLLPEEAHQLMQETKGRFDLSKLNPIETSDLWKNTPITTLDESLDKLPFEEMDEVDFHSSLQSQTGKYRFNVVQKNEKGVPALYTMMISKGVHSVLLAKALLRKLGYIVPAVKYLPKVILRFKSETQKKGFISYLENVAFAGAAENWVIEELDNNRLLVQDLIVMNSQHIIYNLATGPILPDIIQGRRLLSSLSIPLTVVNLEESVNMLRWNAGYIEDNSLRLFLSDPDRFQTTWEDARWIGRRIEKLTRADWEEVVAASNVPQVVQMILIEKIISRRNSMLKLLDLDHKTIKVDSDLTHGVELVRGKITQENWPGYGSRFAYGDPESPLSESELTSWIKSKAISLGLDLGMSVINQLPYTQTDINGMHQQKYEELIDALKAQNLTTGVQAPIPFKPWIFPTYGGDLILSRNIVTGTYLGTDSLVQLADIVGVSASGGFAVGTAGLPAGVMMNASAGANFTRTYTHLRPVTSIQKALKYKFKNIFVPMVKTQYGNTLHQAMVECAENEEEESCQNKIADALKPFKENLQIGESFIVTDALSTSLGISAGYKYSEFIKLALGIGAGHIVMNRFHVHRRSEDVVQIYKDLGQGAFVGASFALNSLVPIFKISYKPGAGTAKTKFYSININPKNPDVIKNISALRRAIVHSSLKEVKTLGEPYVLAHNYREKNFNANLLMWQYKNIDSSDKIQVTHPSGEKRSFERQYWGFSRGRNYVDYASNLISSWVSSVFKRDLSISDSGTSNPGYSFHGKAYNKILSYDVEVTNGEKQEPFIRLNKIWNGWSTDRKKAEKVVSEIEEHYRYDYFPGPVLNDTTRIFMYNISVNFLVYKAAIEHMLSLSEEEIKEIFSHHQAQDDLTVHVTETNELSSGVKKFLRRLKLHKKHALKGRDRKANKYLLKAISHADKRLNLEGLTKLFGSKESFYTFAKIDGFREGDEDGDQTVMSNSYGEYGSPIVQGPLVQLLKQTEMLEGEFFIYWMMTRLI